jgi:F-box domain
MPRRQAVNHGVNASTARFPTPAMLPEEIIEQVLASVDLLDLLRCRAVRPELPHKLLAVD